MLCQVRCSSENPNWAATAALAFRGPLWCLRVRGWEVAAMSREEIISANPIADSLRNRGHELKRAAKIL